MLTLIKNICLSGFIIIVVSSCSTLSKDECKTANWRTIGYGDGAKGYKASRISQHRSACAEYGVSPNLNAYNTGRSEGLGHYCVPSTAYNKGLYGYSYNGVCTGYNERDFLDAYNYGLTIYKAKKTVRNLKNNYAKEEHYIARLERKLQKKEHILVSGKLSKVKALILLNETKEIAEELGKAKSNLDFLGGDINKELQHVEYLKNQGNYN